MASKEASFISDPKEQQWVVEITQILKNQLETDHIRPSVSIFHVPDTLTTKKPEAYEPQQLGLGPIHHFRPGPYMKTEQKKLEVLRKVLLKYGNYFENYTLILNKVCNVVPVVRSCYDMFLRGEDDSLARVFVIDGMFLLNLFDTYNTGRKDKERYLLNLQHDACDFKLSIEERKSSDSTVQDMMEKYDILRQEEVVVTSANRAEWERLLGRFSYGPVAHVLPQVGPENRLLAQDIMLVENQIPFIVLKEIHEALPSSSNEFSPLVFRSFCKIHSPLKLCSKSQAPASVEHLLHYMYYSILNNVPVVPVAVVNMAEISLPVKESLVQVFTFATKIPKDEIVQAYKQTISFLETFSQTKFLIPSVSKLYDKSEIRFKSLVKHQGIQNIRLELRSKSVYLPCITLNNDSEVILRNLIAYETLMPNSDSFPLTEYMALMCGLVVNVNDVKLLRKDDIIKGGLSDVEVAKLFIGMKSSIPTMKTEGKSELQKTIYKINKIYESGLRIKIYLFLKKLAGWLLLVLKAIGGFVESSWKIGVFIASIVTVVILVWKAYCDVFGCDKTSVTLLPYTL